MGCTLFTMVNGTLKTVKRNLKWGGTTVRLFDACEWVSHILFKVFIPKKLLLLRGALCHNHSTFSRQQGRSILQGATHTAWSISPLGNIQLFVLCCDYAEISVKICRLLCIAKSVRKFSSDDDEFCLILDENQF